jgi:hypothetical protein
MAGRRKKGAPIVALDSDDAFQAAIEQSTKFLIVVDIHQGWCGPCTTMEPIYNKAYIELDRAEDRLKFFTIDAEKLSAESRKGLPVTESCKPLFVVFKVQMRASFPSPHRALTAYAPPPFPPHHPFIPALSARRTRRQLQRCWARWRPSWKRLSWTTSRRRQRTTRSKKGESVGARGGVGVVLFCVCYVAFSPINRGSAPRPQRALPRRRRGPLGGPAHSPACTAATRPKRSAPAR